MNIAVCGFYGKHNIGDDIMQSEIHDFFRSQGHQPRFYGDKKGSLNGIEILNWDVVNPLDDEVICIGGGGIVTPSYYMLTPTMISHIVAQGKKVLFFNVNLTQESVPILKAMVPVQCFWVVRDKYSIDLLESHGHIGVLAADIAFNHFAKYPKADSHRRVISVCCNDYVFHSFFGTDVNKKQHAERAYYVLRDFLRWMMDFNWDVQFIPAQVDRKVNDVLTNGVLYGMLGNSGTWHTTEDGILEALSKSNLIISTRYHVSLFALAARIPLIDITHHSKNKNLLEETGLSGISEPYYDISLRGLKDKAEWLKHHYDQYNAACAKINEFSRDSWGVMPEIIRKFLYA